MTLLPHGPLEKLADDVWMVKGEVKMKLLGRRMVIVRDREGGLFIHNAIMLDDAGFRELDALGPVRTIFVPNKFHDMDGGRMKERYPAAKLVSLSAVKDKLKNKFPTLEVLEGSLLSLLPPTVSIAPIPGLKGDESVMEIRNGKVTQVYTDAFFNLQHGDGFPGFLLKLVGSTGGFKTTGIAKVFILKDRAAFRAYVEAQMARTDIERVIVSHGEMVEGDTSAAFSQALKSIS